MKRLKFIGLAAVTAASLGAAGGIAMSETDTKDALAAWRAQEGQADWRGIDRRDSLEAAKAALTPGTGRDEVRTLLGAPDADYGSEWVYAVAPGGAVTWDYRLLVVRFDAAGAVSETRDERSETYAPPS